MAQRLAVSHSRARLSGHVIEHVPMTVHVSPRYHMQSSNAPDVSIAIRAVNLGEVMPHLAFKR